MMELNLKIPKEELFDPYVLTPHNELNDVIYREVDRLLDSDMVFKLHLCIFTDVLNDVIKEKVIEIYREHYQDRQKKLKREMWRVYIRAISLIIISLTLLYCSIYFSANDPNRSIIFVVMSNVGAYLLWQVGDTWFDWVSKEKEIARVQAAMKAPLTFAVYKKKKSEKN